MIHGYAPSSAGADLLPYSYDPGPLSPHDVEVQVTHCGVCHTDSDLVDGWWNIGQQFPFIPGHEIAGTVSVVGEQVQHLAIGQRVGIGLQTGSCGSCRSCMHGKQELCP